MQRIDEDVVRRVTSSSFSTRHKSKRVKWNQVETLKFYDGLSYFGTDFGMISLMFPGLDRKQLKLKFHAEERIRPDLITKALKTVKKPSEELRSLMRAALPEPKSTNKPKQSPLAPPASSTNTNETPEHPELSMEPNTQETLVDTDCIIATAAVEQVLEPIVSDAVQEKINNTLAARSTSTQLTNSALKTAPVIPTRRRKRPAESTAVELPIETPFAAEQ